MKKNYGCKRERAMKYSYKKTYAKKNADSRKAVEGRAALGIKCVIWIIYNYNIKEYPNIHHLKITGQKD